MNETILAEEFGIYWTERELKILLDELGNESYFEDNIISDLRNKIKELLKG